MGAMLRETVECTEDGGAAAESQRRTAAALVELYFDDLRALAAAHMRRERAEHTLQPPALANVVFVRLGGEWGRGWTGREHFLFAASVAIRRILIDHARGRGCVKRGGGVRRERVDEGSLEAPGCDVAGLVNLDREVEALTALHPRPGAVVQMRFFGGLTEAKIAAILGVTERTVRKDWAFARAWLHRRLRGGEGD
jgi:RNA polymerase sigma factor (TIGR02999 family)